jgi:hypothetical protein
MKKIFILLFSVMLSVALSAQLPVASKIKNLGAGFTPGTIVSFNSNLADTLKSADTLVYKVAFSHSKIAYAYISELTKLVANDTTVYVRYYQSVDGKTNLQLLKTVGAYNPPTNHDTIAKSTTAGRDIDLYRKGLPCNSQYLIIWFKAATKSNFKTILYGSVRLNEY